MMPYLSFPLSPSPLPSPRSQMPSISTLLLYLRLPPGLIIENFVSHEKICLRVRPRRHDRVRVIEVVHNDLPKVQVVRLVSLDRIGRDIIEVVILLDPQVQRGADGVVQLPPDDVAVSVLGAVLVVVAVGCEPVLHLVGVVDAAEGRLAGIPALPERTLDVVLVADKPQVEIVGAGDAARTRVRAAPPAVLVLLEGDGCVGGSWGRGRRWCRRRPRWRYHWRSKWLECWLGCRLGCRRFRSVLVGGGPRCRWRHGPRRGVRGGRPGRRGWSGG
mmetsp:Transcript_62947/g.185917  ORF Transcript_62947/g.185917 Transcript_62947/m.185917 type:complete len:273 (+) Transcript_62947:35-853(+)